MIPLAEREWDYFGRQTVVYRGPEESIPQSSARVGQAQHLNENRIAKSGP
jgi:hypothetical protein